MDWVHCNSCYVQPGDVEKKKFFITNCGHIYCDECHQPTNSHECRVCLVQYKAIPLTSNMSSEVGFYFHDPLINLKKQMKVFEFQQSHRMRLISYHRERLRHYKAIKKENFNLSEELKLCKNENSELREEIQRIKRDFQEYKKKFDQTMSGKSVRMNSFRQFMTKNTPEVSSSALPKKTVQSDDNFNLKISQPPPSSNFFIMTESKSTVKNDINFTTPDLPKFQSSYRSCKTSTPDMSTPPTPETFFRECYQKDLQRKVKLPSGPSPTTRIGFHGLTLSKPSSALKRGREMNNSKSFMTDLIAQTKHTAKETKTDHIDNSETLLKQSHLQRNEN